MQALLLPAADFKGRQTRSSHARVASLFSFGPGRSAAAALFILLLTIAASDARAQFPGELVGRVSDATSGEPLEGALVELIGTELTTLSDGRGEFRLRALEPGRYAVRISRLGYAPSVREVEVRNGSATSLSVTLAARPFNLEEIRAEARRDAPGTVRISRAEIERRGAQTAADALDGEAGLVIRRRGPTGAQTVSIRGSAADQVLVLLDGAPLNDPVTGSADLSTISAAQIQSITVLKGSQSARYGAGAEAGTVLIESRSAAGPLGFRGGAGSLGAWTGDVEAGSRVGAYAWSAGGYARGVDGEFRFDEPEALGGGEATRANNDLSEAGGFAAASGPLAGGVLRGRLGYTRLERGLPGLAFLPSSTAREELDRWRGQASWERARGRASYSAQLHGLTQTTRFSDRDPPLGRPFDSRTEALIVGGRANGELRFDGGLESAFAGLKLEGQSYESTSFDESAPDGRFDFGGFVGASLSAPNASLAPRLVGAVRLDRDGLEDIWRATHELTASAAAGPIDLYLRHASSYSPPTFGDQFFNEGVAVEPNPDLRAERVPNELAAGFEVAGRVASQTRAGFAIDGYIADVKDMIIWAPDSRFVWSPRNFDVKRRGLDVEGQLNFASPDVELRASYALARVTYDREGDADTVQVIYRPRHTGGLSAYWRPARWELGVDVRYIGTRYPVPAKVNALDPYWTIGLSFRRSFNAGAWQLTPRLIIDRLNDNKDSFIFGYPEPGRTVRIEIAAMRRSQTVNSKQ